MGDLIFGCSPKQSSMKMGSERDSLYPNAEIYATSVAMERSSLNPYYNMQELNSDPST